jgi:hypothetical protein
MFVYRQKLKSALSDREATEEKSLSEKPSSRTCMKNGFWLVKRAESRSRRHRLNQAPTGFDEETDSGNADRLAQKQSSNAHLRHQLFYLRRMLSSLLLVDQVMEDQDRWKRESEERASPGSQIFEGRQEWGSLVSE